MKVVTEYRVSGDPLGLGPRSDRFNSCYSDQLGVSVVVAQVIVAHLGRFESSRRDQNET